MKINIKEIMSGVDKASPKAVSTLGNAGVSPQAFLDIHYHGKDAGALVGQPTRTNIGTSAFLDIHYHGKDVSEVAGNVMRAEAAPTISPSSVAGKVTAAKNVAAVKDPGTAAFLDIHYHGKDVGAMAGQPAVVKDPGTAAFLDIHYHGKDVGAMAGQPAVVKDPGTAAFLDIHYHGKDVGAMAGQPAVVKDPGTAAFLDIHYHGKDVGAMAAGVMRPEAGTSIPPSSASMFTAANVATSVNKPGTAAFLDIHYHGKAVTETDIANKPGLHIGDAALLDIHYHE